MNRYLIVVAGGSGTRMEADLPKQFLLLNGMPILMRTITRFYDYDPTLRIILVLPESQMHLWSRMKQDFKFDIAHEVVAGGNSRFESVKNGLMYVFEDGLIAIHDGVRPLVSSDTIDRCFKTAYEKGNAIPALTVNESLRVVHNETNSAVDRSSYFAIQTPQVFRSFDIKRAYEQPFSELFTDDASVLESFGKKINLVEGNRENIKITHPIDLKIAEAILVI